MQKPASSRRYIANMDANYNPPPPYAAKSTSIQEDFLDHLTRRMVAVSEAEQSAIRELETERLRNFLEFALSMDYQRNTNAALSASDRAHFSQLWSNLQDLRAAYDNTRPTPAENTTLASYFWRYLHQPCKELCIPVEYALIVIERFFKYLVFCGRYKGCVFGLLHNAGIESLAAKLYIDQEVIIPRVFGPGEQRQAVLRSLGSISTLYFERIYGMAASTMAADNKAGWEQLHSVEFTANERGLAYEARRKDADSHASTTSWLSPSHWAERVRVCMMQILSRHMEVQAGTRRKDAQGSWRGSHDEIPAGTGRSHLWHVPVGWKCWFSLHLPDFFESRPIKGCAEM